MNRLGFFLLKSIGFIVICGALYQFISTKIDEYKYPPFGELIEVDGHKMHIYKTGPKNYSKGPTVILDMGLGGNLLYWHYVQSKVSNIAQVVSYDRAGLGWSEENPKSRTSEHIVEELHKLLHNSEIKGPYILVGHSFAGINARIFANKYPNEVAGIVLVDSSHEDQIKNLPEQKDWFSFLLRNKIFHPVLIMLTDIGFTRAFNKATYDHVLPDDIHNMLLAKNSTSSFIKTLIKEWAAFPENLDYSKKLDQNLGSKPLIVVTAGMKPGHKECASRGFDTIPCKNAYDAWQKMQKDLTTKSTNSKQIFAKESGHNIPIDDPDIIAAAVSEIITKYK